MFYLDVSKVDFGVAHVAVAICAYFKCLICFRRMLQVFYLDDPKVDLEKAHAVACAPPLCAAMGHRTRLLLLLALLCAYERVKRNRLRVVLCMHGPTQPPKRDGSSSRKLGVLGAGAGASST
jgi:hypothetical protein